MFITVTCSEKMFYHCKNKPQKLGVRMRIFSCPHPHHCVRIPANSRTFQDLQRKFAGLSRNKIIFRDFPRPGNFTKKFQDFPGGLGTLDTNSIIATAMWSKWRTWSVIGAVVGSCSAVCSMSITCCLTRDHDDCSPPSLLLMFDVSVLLADDPSLYINMLPLL